MSVFQKFIDRIQRTMIGRNGPDECARFCLWVALAFFVASVIVGDATARSVLSALALAALVYCYVRMFSKNIAARSRENGVYLRIRDRMRVPFLTLIARVREWKRYGRTHRRYRCETCGQRLRIPKGKGTVKVTCPKCHTTFTTKS